LSKCDAVDEVVVWVIFGRAKVKRQREINKCVHLWNSKMCIIRQINAGLSSKCVQAGKFILQWFISLSIK